MPTCLALCPAGEHIVKRDSTRPRRRMGGVGKASDEVRAFLKAIASRGGKARLRLPAERRRELARRAARARWGKKKGRKARPSE